MVIIASSIFQNRRLNSLKDDREKKSKERNNSKGIYEIPFADEGNYEQVVNEQSTYTAPKKPG